MALYGSTLPYTRDGNTDTFSDTINRTDVYILKGKCRYLYFRVASSIRAIAVNPKKFACFIDVGGCHIRVFEMDGLY